MKKLEERSALQTILNPSKLCAKQFSKKTPCFLSIPSLGFLYLSFLRTRESKCAYFFVQTRSHKKSVHPAFSVKWTNFLEFLRILGFINIIVWVFVDNMLVKFGFHMGRLLYGIVFLSIRLNTLIR